MKKVAYMKGKVQIKVRSNKITKLKCCKSVVRHIFKGLFEM